MNRKEYSAVVTFRTIIEWIRLRVWSLATCLISVLAAFVLGWMLAPRVTTVSSPKVPVSGLTDKSRRIKHWTCAMHPQIKYPDNRRKCPICFMALIPVYASPAPEQATDNGPLLSLGQRARRLAQIATTAVVYRRLVHQIFMVGKVAYDETRVFNITLRPSGKSRLEQLFANFTGAVIRKGQPLYRLYSPSLIAAQGEYLAALRNPGSRNLAASQQKLLDFGMNREQIKELARRGKVMQTITIYAREITGTVVAKIAHEGTWYTRGAPLLRVVDLSAVWVKLDAYESDLHWIRYGQQVSFVTESYPGRSFKGRIALIAPFVDERTRTVKVRVNVSNQDGLLKPGMFVRARLAVQLAEGGQVFDPDLAGKWICPLHPEVIEATAGTCPRCGQGLVAAENLGYTRSGRSRWRVLCIPYTAPLLTGKRAIVYVEQGQAQRRVYRGREVRLGPRAGNYYVVLSGLEEGERVVRHGAFKIDAALQIRGAPSMMNPARSVARKIPVYALYGGAGLLALKPVLHAYLQLCQDLAADRAADLARHLTKIRAGLQRIRQGKTGLPDLVARKFQQQVQELVALIPTPVPDDLIAVRRLLAPLSVGLIGILRRFGNPGAVPLYQMYCPMACNNQGARWLQTSTKLANPYFGVRMLRCGKQEDVLTVLRVGDIGRGLMGLALGQDPHLAFHGPMRKVIKHYLLVAQKLANDHYEGLEVTRTAVLTILNQIKTPKTFPAKTRQQCDLLLSALKLAVREMQGPQPRDWRRDFLEFSRTLINFLEAFGHTYGTRLWVLHCPMYRHRLGGDWLQTSRQVCNPYYGKTSAMYRCGQVSKSIPALDSKE